MLAKTLSACNNGSRFLKFNTAQFLLQKLRGQEEGGEREGENKRTKQLERVEGGVHLHTKIIHKDIGT